MPKTVAFCGRFLKYSNRFFGEQGSAADYPNLDKMDIDRSSNGDGTLE